MTIMRTFILLICACFTLTSNSSFGQKNPKIPRYFGDAIITDSSSTILIPTRYNADISASNKLSLFGDYYANIIFYNFINDTQKKLFSDDTYIIRFSNPYYRYDNSGHKNNMTSQWLFYKVKNIDHNKNGRIDNEDPSILFVSDIYGDNLKSLSTENENVVDISIFEKQNFALIKFQRDQDNDGNFEHKDKDFYYVKLDLTTLTFGKKIEIE
jgi:hypothetical protein